jgi:sortase A
MKKTHNFSTILTTLIFFTGLAVLLYPSVSNYINQIHATHAVENYDTKLNTIQDGQYDEMLEAARTYNKKLAEKPSVYLNGDPQSAEYKDLLDITGDGMMGYITIQKIKVLLPVYHGTSNDILSSGAGHLEGSSLPVGGADTHAVITGHRGLPAAKLFTDLDRLETGDTFTLNILNETLTYEIDDISIVLPDEISKINIIPGGDYVTLVTCTPYAVNTHRLLVRGKRIDNPKGAMRVTADAMQIDPMIAAPVLAAPVLLILLILLFTAPKKRNRTADRTDKSSDGTGETAASDLKDGKCK